MDAIRKGGRTGKAWLFGRAACAAASVAFPTSAKPGKHSASKAPAIRSTPPPLFCRGAPSSPTSPAFHEQGHL